MGCTKEVSCVSQGLAPGISAAGQIAHWLCIKTVRNRWGFGFRPSWRGRATIPGWSRTRRAGDREPGVPAV